jgi:hypothetical protein
MHDGIEWTWQRRGLREVRPQRADGGHAVKGGKEPAVVAVKCDQLAANGRQLARDS